MNKPKILFVGPAGFNEHSWRTRSEYILPDLFTSVFDFFDIHILTGPLPDYAIDSMAKLCNRFNACHHEVKYPGRYGDLNQRWKAMVLEYASKILPDVISNSLGSLRLGSAIVNAAKLTGARSVIRVAGDEIGSRFAMGIYDNNQQLFDSDKAIEREGFIGADSIIAMSPWERSRIHNVVGSDSKKVEICIRGVDVSKFFNADDIEYQKITFRFLYVGRKSAEKGYDIIEEAANIIFKTRKDIEFIFVGNFQAEHVKNRRYIGWVDVSDLPHLYKEVDAFVLTSRSEGFPQVLAEAMASGLPCILSGHLFSDILIHEIDALLVNLDPSDVASKIQHLADNVILRQYLSKRSRQIALRNFSHEYWQQRYIALLKGEYFDKCTILDVYKNKKIASKIDNKQLLNPNTKIRVVLILPRRLGAIGTPGSYNLADSLHNQVELHCISNSAADKNSDVEVVSGIKSGIHLSKINFNRRDYKEKVLEKLIAFRPDVVHVVNWHGWTELVPYLKTFFSEARYVIDFKTPLMAEGDKRHIVQINGTRASKSVDLVLSRNTEDVATWIELNAAPTYVYPLGVALTDLTPRAPEEDKVRKCKRFVYVGSTHEKRKLDSLIVLISCLPREILEHFTLDCYGSGGDHDLLNTLIVDLGLTNCVNLKGALPQHELFDLLNKYDCGLAWVPREIYDAAPSIKYLEYLGSGLVVLATDTVAHRRNLASGLHSILFSESAQSFTNAIRSVMNDGYDVSRIKSNLLRIVDYSWDNVAKNHIVQAYRRLVMGYFELLTFFAYDDNAPVIDGSVTNNFFDSHADLINLERFLYYQRKNNTAQ